MSFQCTRCGSTLLLVLVLLNGLVNEGWRNRLSKFLVTTLSVLGDDDVTVLPMSLRDESMPEVLL